MKDQPLIVSLGGGLNSTAMLVEFQNRGIQPDAILFSDTGGEHPHTYNHLWALQEWLESVGMPNITVVHNEGKHRTLEDRCLTDGHLPSIVYGFRSCSQRFKHEPMDKWVNRSPWGKEAKRNGTKITRAIGIDAGEAHRAKQVEHHRFDYWYPLVEWDIDREDCVEIVKASPMCVPKKSSCFFCPAMKKREIRHLYENYPDLMDRALAMEDAAAEYQVSVKGLGRQWSWRDFMEQDKKDAIEERKQTSMFTDTEYESCFCDT